MPIDMKYMMLIQLGLEVLLVLLLIALLLRSKKAEQRQTIMPENLQETIEHFLYESEKIANSFTASLQNKKELSADLILKLDNRLSNYRLLLKQAEDSFKIAEKKLDDLKTSLADSATLKITDSFVKDKANPAEPEVQAMVLRLAKNGLSMEEIASQTKLLLGEVELIIDLERQFSL